MDAAAGVAPAVPRRTRPSRLIRILLDAEGGFANPATREVLAKFQTAFTAWTERNAA
jgi:hypothetical protein